MCVSYPHIRHWEGVAEVHMRCFLQSKTQFIETIILGINSWWVILEAQQFAISARA